MIDPKQIPDEVVEAGAEEILLADCPGVRWQDVSELERRIYRDLARRTIVAALNAWPGMDVTDDDDWCAIYKGTITLPQAER